MTSATSTTTTTHSLPSLSTLVVPALPPRSSWIHLFPASQQTKSTVWTRTDCNPTLTATPPPHQRNMSEHCPNVGSSARLSGNSTWAFAYRDATTHAEFCFGHALDGSATPTSVIGSVSTHLRNAARGAEQAHVSIILARGSS